MQLENIINVKLLSNPVNWIIVILMVLLGGLLISLILESSNNE